MTNSLTGLKNGVKNNITYDSDSDFSLDTNWYNSSDIRMKKNIEHETIGLSFINKLNPKTYKLKAPSEFPKEWNSYNENITKPINEETISGFIAQEIKEALDSEENDTLKCWDIKKDSQQTISTGKLIIPLVNAVKELSQQVTDLKKDLYLTKLKISYLL